MKLWKTVVGVCLLVGVVSIIPQRNIDANDGDGNGVFRSGTKKAKD
jgi:hypothetical protein